MIAGGDTSLASGDENDKDACEEKAVSSGMVVKLDTRKLELSSQRCLFVLFRYFCSASVSVINAREYD